jgi:phosphoribosylamine--glycine ligase
MGSGSDLAVMTEASKILERLEISHEMRVLSAHRTPTETAEYAASARGRGIEVLICGAGLAAHLAGVVAGHTDLPVIGVPLNTGALQGLDALLATVQMPPGVPVATVAIGSPGAKNAAWLAARIIATHDDTVRAALETERQKMVAKVYDADKKAQAT